MMVGYLWLFPAACGGVCSRKVASHDGSSNRPILSDARDLYAVFEEGNFKLRLSILSSRHTSRLK